MIKNFEEIEDYKVIMDDTKRTSLTNKEKGKDDQIQKRKDHALSVA